MTKEELQAENDEMRAYIETLEAKVNTYEQSNKRQIPVVNIDGNDYEVRGGFKFHGTRVSAADAAANAAKYDAFFREFLLKGSGLLNLIETETETTPQT